MARDDDFRRRAGLDTAYDSALHWADRIALHDAYNGTYSASEKEKRMGEYTKGPWRISDMNTDPYKGPPGEIAIRAGRNYCVAVAEPCGGEGDTRPDVTMANARLIAAAPELLDACKSLLETDVFTGSVIMGKKVQAAKEAIAKAEGRRNQ